MQALSVAAATAADPTTAAAADEQTQANNTRLVVVDQGEGPYRVLYVSGRPSWEFKFLNRAIEADKQVNLVGLIRIAKRQPKFDFVAKGSQTTSPLFNGFDNADPEAVEAADQPVFVRLGTRDPAELRDGFPKTAEGLFDYHAVILDDVEASFFAPDQMTLLRNFVSQRGGGLLMLGGPDSFAAGKYDRTPVGDLLPVYLDRGGEPPPPSPSISSEPRPPSTAWSSPAKAGSNPGSGPARPRTTSRVPPRRPCPPSLPPTASSGIKPGAAVLAQVRDATDDLDSRALVAQSFGKGHVAALLIGDLWRWGLRRASVAEDDLDRSWRQTVRWLVADVPHRVELTLRAKVDAPAPSRRASSPASATRSTSRSTTAR